MGSAGAAIFPALGALGVEWVFVNSGTDFPPIIEGLAEAAQSGADLPRAVTVPHEHAAMGLAHGACLATGRAQAVMLHTNVGLANGATGAINAAAEQVPMVIMSGRTPVTEAGRFGARTVPIGWGQEMRDQAALVREACKWDYELRFPEQIGPLLARAHAIAMSPPRGPVYLSLPREVLCAAVPEGAGQAPGLAPVAVAAAPAALDLAAEWLAGAEAPLVIAQRGAEDAETFAAFAGWAEEWGVAVASWWATRLAIPTDHPCHVGPDPGARLAEADVVLVLDALAPWMPDRHAPRLGAKVIQAGADPLFQRFPVRGFPADLALGGEIGGTLRGLMGRMGPAPAPARERAARLAAETAAARAAPPPAMAKGWAGHCLGRALGETPSRVFSELGVSLGALPRRAEGSWFQEPHSGGLGWSFPAALGAALADPERVAVATMGDGSYLFANPAVCHQVAEATGAAILVVVLNDAGWGAVRRSVTELYPGGAAARANAMPLTGIAPAPDIAMIARASRGWAITVETPGAVEGALREGLRVVREERRCATVEIRLAAG